MDCSICRNQQQINVAMVMVQVHLGRNCIEHFKGFDFMNSFTCQMWVPMSAFSWYKCMYFALGQKKVADNVHF